MKKITLFTFVLLALGASATRVKRNHNLVVESFRGFNNTTKKLGTTNDRYFTFSGPNYGVGNNDWGQKPIFTLYKSSRIAINYGQLKFFYPEYFDFNWMVVFKIPDSAKFTLSNFPLTIDGLSINFFAHRTNVNEAYCYTMRIAEYMKSPSTAYYIERTDFSDYPFTDPLLIDTIYLRGYKWEEDGTDPEDENIGLFIERKNIKIHSDHYFDMAVEVMSHTGEVILSEPLTGPDCEFPLNVQNGAYWVFVFQENRAVISRHVYLTD